MKKLLDLLKHRTWVELVNGFLEFIFILFMLVLIYRVYTRWGVIGKR